MRNAMKFWALSMAFCVGSAHAQVTELDPDWQETAIPVPPSFSKEHLVHIEMPPYVSLKFGIDPATLSITPDGILRYVMVAQNASGSLNAMYEGLRCATGQVKTYARTSSTSGTWSVVKDPQWRDLSDNLPSKHAIALVQQGVCEGRTVAGRTVQDVIRVLKR